MIHTRLTHLILPFPLAGLLLVAGCNKNQQPQQNAEQPATAGQPPAGQTTPTPGTPPPAATPAAPPQPVSYTIPAGTHVTVRLGQSISSQTAHAGDAFEATVTSPITVQGTTVVAAGSPASGVVTDANSRGKFKGAAVLGLKLTSLRVNGQRVQVDSSEWTRSDSASRATSCPNMHRGAAPATGPSNR